MATSQSALSPEVKQRMLEIQREAFAEGRSLSYGDCAQLAQVELEQEAQDRKNFQEATEQNEAALLEQRKQDFQALRCSMRDEIRRISTDNPERHPWVNKMDAIKAIYHRHVEMIWESAAKQAMYPNPEIRAQLKELMFADYLNMEWHRFNIPTGRQLPPEVTTEQLHTYWHEQHDEEEKRLMTEDEKDKHIRKIEAELLYAKSLLYKNGLL